MPRFFVVITLACLLVLPAAVGAQEAAVEASDGAASAGFSVTFNDPGAEPRTLLRYDLAAIGEQRVQMDVDTSMSVGMGAMGGAMMSQVLPTIRTTMQADAAELLPDGTARVAYQFGEFELVPGREGVDPMMENVLRSSLSAVGTMRGVMVMDDTGRVLSNEYDLSELDDATRQQVESTLQSFEQSVMPLPPEPVGVGASWTSTMQVSAGGMSLDQVSTYELIELGDGQVSVRVSVVQTAEQQSLQAPGLPPGATAELISFASTGGGVMSLHFDRVVPDGEMSVTSDMAMRAGEAGGMAMDMTMDMEMEVRITTLP